MTTQKHINEISKDLLDKATQKQDKLLKSPGYLKKISAWQYLRCMKRLDDFRKYADAMVDAINNGNIGTSEDIGVPQRQADKAAEEITAQKQETIPTQQTPPSVKSASADGQAISIDQRKSEISGRKPANFNNPEPKCPKIPFASRPRPGKYIVKYISTMDDDICTIWVEAKSINGAMIKAKKEFWDIKEILTVEFDEQKKEQPSEQIIDNTPGKPIAKLGAEVASAMTDGEFNSMPELVADIFDDRVTLNCASGVIYVGETLKNVPWAGPKASYKLNYETGIATAKTSKYDHDVEIVTNINEFDEDDVKEPGKFNLDIFKKTLRDGIVHFNYTRVDGKERQAYGTVNEDILLKNGVELDPNYYENGKDKKNKSYPNLLSYYDMTSHGWRSFVINNINTIYDEGYDEVKQKKTKRIQARKKLTKK